MPGERVEIGTVGGGRHRDEIEVQRLGEQPEARIGQRVDRDDVTRFQGGQEREGKPVLGAAGDQDGVGTGGDAVQAGLRVASQDSGTAPENNP